VRRSRGFSQLEFVVVGLVVSVLAFFYLDTLHRVQAEAEKTMVEMNVRSFRFALKLQVLQRIMQGRGNELSGLAGENPVAWMETPPDGYVGERDAADFAWLEAGHWGFSRKTRELAYRPRVKVGLAIEGDGDVLRWQVRTRLPLAMAGDSAAARQGFDVESVANYRWQP
jgi:hypothetical protein